MKFWLIVALVYPGQESRWAAGHFKTLDQCLAALDKAEVVIPNFKSSPKDGKASWAGFKACVPSDGAPVPR